MTDRAGRDYPPGDLRVSDAERDRALRELSQAFEVGRITGDELDQRSGKALAARTGSELSALLADLPVERGPAPRAGSLDRAGRLFATRVSFAAGIAALCFAGAAASNVLNHGPSLHQRELAQQVMASHGLTLPLPPAPGFDWIGTMTPGAIAVLLVMLVVWMRVRIARADRA
jgi:hypothetical protein